MTVEEALKDVNSRLDEWEMEPATTLPEALLALQMMIGTDCECDNTHQTNNTQCCLCQYQAVLSQPTA